MIRRVLFDEVFNSNHESWLLIVELFRLELTTFGSLTYQNKIALHSSNPKSLQPTFGWNRGGYSVQYVAASVFFVLSKWGSLTVFLVLTKAAKLVLNYTIAPTVLRRYTFKKLTSKVKTYGSNHKV